MDRKTRLCVWIIIIGLGNFLAFLGMYIYIGGDAKNGEVYKDPTGGVHYLIQMRGSDADAARVSQPTTTPDPKARFIRFQGSRIFHNLNGTPYKDIGKEMYIYSGVHSILIWLTVAAVLLAMLTLAKDQLVTAMEDQPISGRTIIHLFAAVVVCTTLMMTAFFLQDFITQLMKVR